MSVEREGAVKCSSTVLPMRVTLRSRTGWGRLRVGARGGPGLAQPNIVKIAAKAAYRRSREAVRPSLRWDKSMAMSLAFFVRIQPGFGLQMA